MFNKSITTALIIFTFCSSAWATKIVIRPKKEKPQTEQTQPQQSKNTEDSPKFKTFACTLYDIDTISHYIADKKAINGFTTERYVANKILSNLNTRVLISENSAVYSGSINGKDYICLDSSSEDLGDCELCVETAELI